MDSYSVKKELLQHQQERRKKEHFWMCEASCLGLFFSSDDFLNTCIMYKTKRISTVYTYTVCAVYVIHLLSCWGF